MVLLQPHGKTVGKAGMAGCPSESTADSVPVTDAGAIVVAGPSGGGRARDWHQAHGNHLLTTEVLLCSGTATVLAHVRMLLDINCSSGDGCRDKVLKSSKAPQRSFLVDHSLMLIRVRRSLGRKLVDGLPVCVGTG